MHKCWCADLDEKDVVCSGRLGMNVVSWCARGLYCYWQENSPSDIRIRILILSLKFAAVWRARVVVFDLTDFVHLSS